LVVVFAVQGRVPPVSRRSAVSRPCPAARSTSCPAAATPNNH